MNYVLKTKQYRARAILTWKHISKQKLMYLLLDISLPNAGIEARTGNLIALATIPLENQS